MKPKHPKLPVGIQANRFLLAVGILLALALTISCSGDSNDEELSSSSNGGNSSSSSDSGNDIENYRIVKIGEQTWMAENLNYATEGSVCYDNEPINCDKYGRLYNWEAAMKACPFGWHLPTNDEWVELFRYVSGYVGTDEGAERNTVGRYLKAVEGWDDYEEGKGTSSIDMYGFTALPGGLYVEGLEDYIEDFKDGFYYAGDTGFWWSATEETEGNATYFYNMFHDSDYVGHGWIFKTNLHSVRCVKSM